mgnify:CR=1 FL=1
MLAQTVCVGGKVEAHTRGGATEVAAANAAEAALPTNRPLILVTLGSLFTDDIAFFVNVTHAAAELGGHSVVVSGRSVLAPGLLERLRQRQLPHVTLLDWVCLLYTSDAADERSSVDLGGRRIIKKKKTHNNR